LELFEGLVSFVSSFLEGLAALRVGRGVVTQNAIGGPPLLGDHLCGGQSESKLLNSLAGSVCATKIRPFVRGDPIDQRSCGEGEQPTQNGQ
jgi:hypothetical protein